MERQAGASSPASRPRMPAAMRPALVVAVGNRVSAHLRIKPWAERLRDCGRRLILSKIDASLCPVGASVLSPHVSSHRRHRRHRRRAALRPKAAAGGAADVRGDPALGQRPHVGARKRDVARAIPARDDGAGDGVFRLRQRRLDGRADGQQRSGGFLHAQDSAEARPLQEQPRRHRSPMSPRRPGITGQTFGMGCAIGDFDNDGYSDIFITAYGRPILYRNNGNGTFTDITEKSGLHKAPNWTTSAVWFDYDNDGRLDLFLCSFVEFSLKTNVFCGDNKLGKRFYCIPARLPAHAERDLPQQRRRHLHRRHRGHRHRARHGQGPRRGRHRHQQRRPGRSLRRQRHRAELPLRQPRQGQVGGDRPGVGSGLQRQRHAALGHGRRCDRLRPGRQAGPVCRQRRSGDVLALPQRRQRVLLGRRRDATASRRRRACCRAGG